MALLGASHSPIVPRVGGNSCLWRIRKKRFDRKYDISPNRGAQESRQRRTTRLRSCSATRTRNTPRWRCNANPSRSEYAQIALGRDRDRSMAEEAMINDFEPAVRLSAGLARVPRNPCSVIAVTLLPRMRSPTARLKFRRSIGEPLDGRIRCSAA
jgi:hypothetical protein